MNKTNLIIAALISLLFVSSTYGQTWNIGPVGTVIFDDLKVSEDGNVLIGRIENSSLWISNDSGITWNCLDQRLSVIHGATYYLLNIYIIDNEGEVIVISGTDFNFFDRNHLLVSFDSGSTWEDRTPTDAQNLNSGLNFGYNPENDEYWLLQSNEYCFYSYDSGMNWNCIRSVPPTQHNSNDGIYFDPMYPETLYALFHIYDSESSHFQYKIFRATYGPESWDINNVFIDFNEELNLYSGIVWDFIPLSNSAFLANVSVTPLDSLEDWSENNGVAFNAYGNFTDRLGSPYFLSRLFFEDKVVAGRIYAILKGTGSLGVSEDYGLTWYPIEMQGLPELSYYQIDALYQAENSQTLYASILNCGLFKSEDHGVNWEAVNQPEISSFDDLFLTSEYVYLSNHGINWFRYDRESEELEVAGVPNSPDSIRWHSRIVYAWGDTLVGCVRTSPNDHPEDRLFRSFDGGNTWEGLIDVFNKSLKSYSEENYLRLIYKDDDVFYASEDFGSTWTIVPQPVDDDGCLGGYINCLDHDAYYTQIYNNSTNKYGIYKLPVEGEEWLNTGFDAGSSCYPNLSIIPHGLFVSDSERNTWIYRDDTWESRGSIPEEFKTGNKGLVISSDPNYIIQYSFVDNFIYFSPDDGWSWYDLDIEFPFGYQVCRVNQISYDQYEEKVWLVADGLLFWFPVETLLSVKEEHPIQLIPADPKLLTNYPNPFNARTRIQYHLSNPGNVKLDVYDITGRWIKTLEETYSSAGIQNVYFDGTNLTSGTYFIHLQTSTENRSRKITLIK